MTSSPFWFTKNIVDAIAAPDDGEEGGEALGKERLTLYSTSLLRFPMCKQLREVFWVVASGSITRL